ncbi:MAG: hypothetical protein BAJALOKI3v1_40094 [Promethearchaeota archaeon]|jgi:transglutaminase-like putative cysteine protease|nr:MAG: hypothetical protein BAJALOKI3v1_40094 [Candidatus Lokiarchaeota archaeon]
MNNLKEFLTPTRFLDFNKSRVRNKAYEITKDLENEKERAIALFYWVRDNIRYNQFGFYMIPANFKASTTLRRGNGFCVSKAVLLSAMARAVKIPAKIHLADIINHKIPQKIIDWMKKEIFFFHGYSELFLDDKWVKATPVFDVRTSEKGGYPLVEFDGEHDALLASHDKDGKVFVEYVNDRGTYADLPYDEIEIVFNREYADAIEAILNGAK